MLSRFLTCTFPEAIDAPESDRCWVANAIKSQHPGLSILAEALELVDQHGELDSFQTKLKREHPSNRQHDPQHDGRVRDCLTEACAFAWVAQSKLGAPVFCDSEGAPDVRLADGRWMEVKAIHASQEEDERMVRMLSGEVDSGQVMLPNPGLYGKFNGALKDAIEKFERQDLQGSSEPNIVFFNFTAVDTQSILRTCQVLERLRKWADEIERHVKDNTASGGVDIVMCYGYDWREPFRNPFDQ